VSALERDAFHHVRDCLARVDCLLERFVDVLPSDHEHRVDAGGEPELISAGFGEIDDVVQADRQRVDVLRFEVRSTARSLRVAVQDVVSDAVALVLAGQDLVGESLALRIPPFPARNRLRSQPRNGSARLSVDISAQ
jgi:hypothetical protein